MPYNRFKLKCYGSCRVDPYVVLAGINVQCCNVLEINSKTGHVTFFVSQYLVKRINNFSIPAKDMYYK